MHSSYLRTLLIISTNVRRPCTTVGHLPHLHVTWLWLAITEKSGLYMYNEVLEPFMETSP